MKELIETVAAHPWASVGAFVLGGLFVESAGVALARVIRAWRSE